MGKIFNWTDEELTFLRDNYRKYRYVELASILKKSKKSIEIKITRLGLTPKGVTHKRWLKAEDHFLMNHFEEYTDFELGQKFNCTIRNVRERLAELKLKRKIITPIETKTEVQPWTRPKPDHTNPDYTKLIDHYANMKF